MLVFYRSLLFRFSTLICPLPLALALPVPLPVATRARVGVVLFAPVD